MIHIASPTKTLELGDTIAVNGERLVVKQCTCGNQFSMDVPQAMTDAAGLNITAFHHEPLENLTERVRALFRAYPPKEAPDLAVGQKWRTADGVIRTVKSEGQYLRVDGRPWWYKNNMSGKTAHSPGVLGANHPDTLVDLVEEVPSVTTKAVMAEPKLTLDVFKVGQKRRTRGGEVCTAKPEPKAVVKPARGSIWRHKDGGVYMAVPTEVTGMDKFSMVSLNTYPGSHLSGIGNGFGGCDDEFTYLGEGVDLVKVAEPSAAGTIKLELTKRQGETLLAVTRAIGGSPDLSRRGDTNAIGLALRGLGVANTDAPLSGSLYFNDEPVQTQVQHLVPIFKEGQVWRTKGGYLMRVHKIDPNGMGRARVIHTPDGKTREEYDRLWGIHPKGGYCNHEGGNDNLNDGGWMPKGNLDDRFAFVELISG